MAAVHIPVHISTGALMGLWTAADLGKHLIGSVMIVQENKRAEECWEHSLGPNPNHPNTSRKEGLCMSMAERPNSGIAASQVIPIDAPSRGDLWARNQLALAVLNQGRVDREELIAILSGASIEDLLRPKQVG